MAFESFILAALDTDLGPAGAAGPEGMNGVRALMMAEQEQHDAPQHVSSHHVSCHITTTMMEPVFDPSAQRTFLKSSLFIRARIVPAYVRPQPQGTPSFKYWQQIVCISG